MTAPPNSRSPSLPRQRLGGYEIIAKIGQGGMGTVYKAVQLSVNRTVALKVLPPRLAKNKDYVERFLREARAAARLNHPNIVEAIDAGVDADHHYFAMEFIDGLTVDELLKGGPLAETQALRIARDVARALHCAHEADLAHGDVKPGNILLSGDGAAKLADLGLARETAEDGAGPPTSKVVQGTPDYVSPEQVSGLAKPDARSDVYSLGATLYHMLAGRPPFKGSSPEQVMAQHLTEPTPNPAHANPRVSAPVAALVMRAMAKKRPHRCASAQELADAIEALLAAGPRRARRHARRTAGAGRWVQIAVLLVLLGVLAALVLLTR